jgi:Protein of unknown function (DUF1800)
MLSRGLARSFGPLAFLVLTSVLGFSSIGEAQAVASDLGKAGHVLNRIGYGPSPSDLAYVQGIGVEAYIAEQLAPEDTDESGNAALLAREEALFEWKVPSRQTALIAAGELWRYRKGTDEPEPAWKDIAFDDSSWLQGPTGIGFGDGDDQTVLEDMRGVSDDPDTAEDESRPGYTSVYLRQTFQLSGESLAAIGDLLLRVDYDDGFKAYLNGTEIARGNLPAGDVAHNATAGGSHEAGTPEEFDLSSHRNLLRTGANVLAIQAHNRSVTSSDFSIIPELVSREILPGPARRVIRGVDELQRLIHIRGVYSRRQLQAVLAEFWENHLTTDYDKLVDYLDELQNSDATDAMSRDQARAEAAQMEYEEYQFFYDNAMGNFGDLLLYSATSPSMLVYLDNILNVRGKANENYAREILELHAFGVDNRYAQKDIEELAKCFTGWSVCKVSPENAQGFPASAVEPPLQCGVQFEDAVLLDLGASWKYFKGMAEPAPGPGGEPTTAWADVGFDDSGWLDGATGIGYGDGDDATVLNDMRGSYLSVYLRHTFTMNDSSDFANLILEVAYDDGFVAYLNGTEVARSASMEDTGAPPAHDQDTDDNHEADEGAELFNLSRFAGLLRPGENVIGIQVHNGSLNSSDLSILPRLIDRTILPGSVENGDEGAVWRFNFVAEQHDASGKVLFEGTTHEIVVPTGREGRDGLGDALDIVHSMASHPSTAEFICIKLMQRFVSDEITLTTYQDGTAPAELRQLLDEAIAAWNSTEPAGEIAVVMRAILDPADQVNLFWSETAHRAKVKTAVEFINSSLRALGADADGEDLPQLNDAMGMALFTRDDPDGYSEVGSDSIDTASMLERIEFANDLAENREDAFGWDSLGLLDAGGVESPEEIVDFFDEILFQGTLPEANRDLLLQYLTTDADGEPKALEREDTEDFQRRIEELVGLMLSLPQWNFQ